MSFPRQETYENEKHFKFSVYLLIFLISIISFLPVFEAGPYSDDYADFSIYYSEWYGFFKYQFFESMGTFRPLGWFIKQISRTYIESNLFYFRLITYVFHSLAFLFFSISIYNFTKNKYFSFLTLLLFFAQLKFWNGTDSNLDLHNTYQIILFFLSLSILFFSKFYINYNQKYFILSILFFFISSLILESFIFFILIYAFIIYFNRNNIDKKIFNINISIIILTLFFLIFINSINKIILDDLDLRETYADPLRNIFSIKLLFKYVLSIIWSYSKIIHDFFVIEIDLDLDQFNNSQKIKHLVLSIVLFSLCFIFMNLIESCFQKDEKIFTKESLTVILITFLTAPVLILIATKYQQTDFKNFSYLEIYYHQMLMHLGICIFFAGVISKINFKFLRYLIVLIICLVAISNFSKNSLKVDERNVYFKTQYIYLKNILKRHEIISLFTKDTMTKIKLPIKHKFEKDYDLDISKRKKYFTSRRGGLADALFYPYINITNCDKQNDDECNKAFNSQNYINNFINYKCYNNYCYVYHFDPKDLKLTFFINHDLDKYRNFNIILQGKKFDIQLLQKQKFKNLEVTFRHIDQKNFIFEINLNEYKNISLGDIQIYPQNLS